MTHLVTANICSARLPVAIGSRVTDDHGFDQAALAAIDAYDFSKTRVPGQGFIHCPEAVPFVSSGVGPRSTDPKDYVLREHRGIVSAYLKRALAAPVRSCTLVVYTKEAYVRDPDVTPEEATRVKDATHVLVAVLADAGPGLPPLSPYRLVWNLAGGNREAATYTADDIRLMAKAAIQDDNHWVAVADDYAKPALGACDCQRRNAASRSCPTPARFTEGDETHLAEVVERQRVDADVHQVVYQDHEPGG